MHLTRRANAFVFFLVAACVLSASCVKNKPTANPFILDSSSRRKELIDKYSGAASTWQAAYNQANGPDKTYARNDIVNDLMWLADDYYGAVTDQLYKSTAWRNTIFDVLGLSLTAAGSVVDGEGLIAALAATGTGIQGVNLAINKNFLRQQTVEAIVAAMDSQRAEDKKTLVDGMNKDSVQYPLAQALVDVQKYALDSTLTHALIALAQKSAQDAQVKKAALDQAIEMHSTLRAQAIFDAHVTAENALKDSASYSTSVLGQGADAQRAAVLRLALLKTTLNQIDSVLRDPFLPSNERTYFEGSRRQFQTEADQLRTAYKIQ
jgi:hypothetical protein